MIKKELTKREQEDIAKKKYEAEESADSRAATIITVGVTFFLVYHYGFGIAVVAPFVGFIVFGFLRDRR